MSENAASRWAGLRARGLEGGEMEAEGMRGRVRNVVAMREGGGRGMQGCVLMGCTGPREPGWDPTWAAVGRVGKSKMGTSDATAEKGREEGVRRVWRTKGIP
jgi:hypothetical protein